MLMQSEDKKPKTEKPGAGWVFHPGDQATADSEETSPKEPSESPVAPLPVSDSDFALNDVHWTASEYVAHDRGISWFAILGFGAIALAALVYFLTRDFISPAGIVIMAIIFGTFSVKKPRVLDYQIDSKGITIGGKHYPFGIFKSFSVSEEGAIHSLLLMPLKRFMPIISVYYADEDEDRIIQKIAGFLPFEEYRQDLIDRMMNKIHF